MGQYDTHYGNFETKLYEEIRSEAFGEDIGQNSWLTAAEQDGFLTWLKLSSGKTLLDVGCGAGGPALRIAGITGSSVIGVDVHDQAISAARTLAAQRNLHGTAQFRVVDAAHQLPFPDATFDAITCIDAINHLADRPHIISDWARLLKPGGRLLFTDPTVVTGPLTAAEVAARSSVSFYLFVPVGYDERTIAQSGLQLVGSQDVTQNMAEIAARRQAARAARASAVRQIEGDETYADLQKFLAITAELASERRLSRFVYIAER